MVNTKILITLSLIIAILLVPNTIAELVGYWDMEEGSGTTATDYSSYSNDGTHDNGTYVTGKLGTYAYNYSVPSRTDIPLQQQYNNSRSITAAMWYKKNNVITAQENPTYGYAAHFWKILHWGIITWTSDNTLAGCSYINAAWFCVNTSVNLNEWYHVVLTINNTDTGTNVTLWINGEMNGSRYTSGNMSTGTAFAPTIGGHPSLTELFSNITADEVALWDEALISTNISSLYNNGTGLRADQLGVATYDNFTINLTDEKTGDAINTFNATVNGTTYTTTTGTITTAITTANTYLMTVSIEANNYSTKSYPNWNTTNNLGAHITPYFKANITDWLTDTTINTFNITINNTVYYSTTGWAVTDITTNNTGTYSITYEANGYTTETDTGQTVTTDKTNALLNTTSILTINILNATGDLITTSTYWDNVTNVTSSVNPYTATLWNYINETKTQRNITINITDTTRYNKRAYTSGIVNKTNTIINITLDQNQLVLTFSSAVYGVIMDEDNGGYNFTNVTIIYDQIDFSLGTVKAKFNNLTAENFTQYYEYDNDGSAVSDTLEIMTASNNYAWFEIIDAGNAPLSDAKVRLFQLKPILGIYTMSKWKLVGQRLTDSSGNVYFQFDNNAHYKVIVSKDDYTVMTQQIDIADELQVDKSDAIQIALATGSSTTNNGVQINVRRKFTNRTANIYGAIYAPSRDKVEYYTTYYNTTGGKKLEADCNDIDLCEFTLESGDHFSQTGNANITLLIYINGALHDTINIAYDSVNYTQIIPKTDIDDLDTNTTKIILGILLITLACVSGIIWKEQPKAPLHTFFMGSIIVGILNTSFLYLSFVAILYYVLKSVKKIISE